MSVKTWEKEFYPISARDIASEGDARTIIAHSLQKWRGLTPKNLAKHNIKVNQGVLSDRSDNWFDVDSSTCSLCQKYYDVWVPSGSKCGACPLYKLRGGVACSVLKKGERYDPYYAFIEENRPTPMIRLLKKALDVETAKQAKQTKKAKAKKAR